MIEFDFFSYSDERWNDIKVVVRDARGVDADRIERRITPVIRSGDFEQSITGMQPLRSRIEIAASVYRFHNASIRQRPRRDDLKALRKKIDNQQASIIDALTVTIIAKSKYDHGALPLPRDGVDDDMLTATRDYFRKLLRNIDGQIAWAGSRHDNARKTARDHFWNELLAIWCDLGGTPSGKAAAKFIREASKPVMGSAVPTLASIMRWLERRQNKTAKTIKPVLRRATG